MAAAKQPGSKLSGFFCFCGFGKLSLAPAKQLFSNVSCFLCFVDVGKVILAAAKQLFSKLSGLVLFLRLWKSEFGFGGGQTAFFKDFGFCCVFAALEK